ncbi:MAG: hypothetical protein AW07_00429 [Candidatus Accumulibacter sp. SK-11]|nr:MAG: hypothetical protein AW07_00429 [Candidatus Accumulibacter sp. SK-11]
MLHLDWSQIQTLTTAKYVDDELRGVGDHTHGRQRVAIAQDAEIGHRVEVEETRAGEAEKVAQRAVRLPGVGEMGQTVEHVQRFAAGSFDDGMHLVDEDVEPGFGIRMMHLGIRQQRRVIGKAEIDQPSSLNTGRLGVWPDQGKIVIQGLNLPDDVVAALNAAQHGVEFRQAGGRRKPLVHMTRQRGLDSARNEDPSPLTHRASVSHCADSIRKGPRPVP